MNALSASVASRGNARRALALAEEALSLARSGGNRFNEGLAEMNLGVARAGLGQVEEARADFQKALEIRRAIGDRMGVAETDLALARLERDDGRLEPSLDRARQGLEILESLRTEILGHDMRASFFGTLQRHYGFALDLLMRMHSADPRRGFDALALETAERARARSLLLPRDEPRPARPSFPLVAHLGQQGIADVRHEAVERLLELAERRIREDVLERREALEVDLDEPLRDDPPSMLL